MTGRGRQLTVMFTAAGAPQAAPLVRHLKSNGEMPVVTVGVDMRPDAIGRYLCDRFYQIPPAGQDNYQEVILNIIERESVNVLFNCSERDAPELAKLQKQALDRGCHIMVPELSAILRSSDKLNLYQELCGHLMVQVPRYRAVSTVAEVEKAACDLGYPDNNVVIKPRREKGSRGILIVSDNADPASILKMPRAAPPVLSLSQFKRVMDTEQFEQRIVMEYLTGDEVDAMAVTSNGVTHFVSIKQRQSSVSGLSRRQTTISDVNIRQAVESVCAHFSFSYTVAVQFIGGKLLEVNPRPSTVIYQNQLNEFWEAIKLAAGLTDVRAVRERLKEYESGWSTVRYYDQIFLDNNGEWHR